MQRGPTPRQRFPRLRLPTMSVARRQPILALPASKPWDGQMRPSRACRNGKDFPRRPRGLESARCKYAAIDAARQMISEFQREIVLTSAWLLPQKKTGGPSEGSRIEAEARPRFAPPRTGGKHFHGNCTLSMPALALAGPRRRRGDPDGSKTPIVDGAVTAISRGAPSRERGSDPSWPPGCRSAVTPPINQAVRRPGDPRALDRCRAG
jgi:hypothetical protein